jgi:hypothetical protein
VRLSKPIAISGVSQALAKGGCPVCACLKNAQSGLLQGGLRADEVEGICNFHAWALAAAVGVETAARVFHRLPRSGFDGSQSCSFCVRLRNARDPRLREFASDLQRQLVFDWIAQRGSLCRPHIKELLQIVPVKLQKTLMDLDERMSSMLASELQDLVTRCRCGEPLGAGVLGRVAEFLITQRGLDGG